MKDFFISYNKADRVWAEWIAWHLEENSYSVVIQAWDFRPGGNFVLDMQRATEEGARAIAVLSPDYLASKFTAPEWAAFFAQDPTGEKGLLLPVRVRECQPRGMLAQIVYVDLVGKDEPVAREALLAGVKQGRGKPAAPPSPFASAPSQVAPQASTESPRFPNALPAIWNVPHQRNPNFTGREGVLTELHRALGATPASPQAICGLGGIGKTQLVAHYAYRHAADYSVIWWVRAEEPSALATDYAGLAEKLSLPEKDLSDQRAVIEAVRRWLGQNAGWLLIFDNATEANAVRDYLPQSATGHTLITSRNPHWRGIAQTWPVKLLARDEGADFLLKRTGQNDAAAARALAETLGDLPLALEQAGAYIENKGKSLADYLELFRSRRQDLWRRDQPPMDYPETVATTWDLALREIGQESSGGAALMNLCAFLAPDNIQLKFAREGAELLPPPLAAVAQDELELDDAVAALRRYSMVEIENDSLSFHRLAQAVTRDKLPADEKKRWAEAAVKLIDRAFPFASVDVSAWPECSRLLSHAVASTGYAEEQQTALEETARLLNQTSGYLLGRAQFAEVVKLSERALMIVEKIYGSNHPAAAACLANIGAALYGQSDFTGARAYYDQALAIEEAYHGPEHPDVALRLDGLGETLRKLGEYDQALERHERALAVNEKFNGPDHPSIAKTANNLGATFYNLRRYDESLSCYRRALAIDVKHQGLKHPTVATIIRNIGKTLQAVGDLRGAQECYERALRILLETLGDDHPDTVTVKRDLAFLAER
ncbi:MAG TPA: FxSxx-COOH system tetratricopeptide repeat protein [Blastocatellia bacterium]|nr:FxSxx-COOH system tetratricopeptide repeat protein [Blastocatellia bacterium]